MLYLKKTSIIETNLIIQDVLRKVLEFSLSDKVRSQDTVFIFQSVARNPNGRELAWEYFKVGTF